MALRYHCNILPNDSLVCTDVIRNSMSSPAFITLLRQSTLSAFWNCLVVRLTSVSLACCTLCSNVLLSASRHFSFEIQSTRTVLGRGVLSTSYLRSLKVASCYCCVLCMILRMGHHFLPCMYFYLCVAPSLQISASIILWYVWSLGSLSPEFMKSLHAVLIT